MTGQVGVKTSVFPSCRWWNRTVQSLHLSAPLTITHSVSCQKTIEILKENSLGQAPVVTESGYVSSSQYQVSIINARPEAS